MAGARPPSRALTIAAVPRRVGPALLAALARATGVDAAGALSRHVARGQLQPTGDEWAWTTEAREAALAAGALRYASEVATARRVAARFFERRGDEGDLEDAVEHWLALGERGRALALVRERAASLEARGAEAALAPSLERLVSTDGVVPAWLVLLRGRALVRTGRLADALDALELAATMRADGDAPPWLPPRAARHAEAGLLALRLGLVSRAEIALAAARRTGTRRGRAALELLAARLALHAGDRGAAEAGFDRAARLALRVNDGASAAEALSGLGVVAMRAGDPQAASEHYRKALVVSRTTADARLTARVLANLAGTKLALGDWSAATQFDEAAERRARLGDLAGAANSRAGAAASREGAGERARALDELLRARHEASLGGDPALELEIRAMRAGLAARLDDIATARAELGAAERLRAALERPDPLLAGIALEARAEVALASRSLGEALCGARTARRIYATQRAAWHEARATLLLARVARAARHPAAVHRRLRALARIDARGAYRFATAWAAAGALQIGARSVDPTIRAVSRAHLAYAEGRALAPGHAPENTPRPGALRVVDRGGSRIVDVRAAAQLRASELDGLLDLERGELVTPTGRYALGTRRVLVPLLVTLVSAGDAAVDAEALHREVWGVDRFDAVAQTRLKVAVSRARSVLGARAIETMRVRSPGGVAITRYRLAPTLAFVVLARS